MTATARPCSAARCRPLRRPGPTAGGEAWVALDAASLDSSRWRAWTSPGRVARWRPAAWPSPPERVLGGLTAGRGQGPRGRPARRRGGRHRRLGGDHRRGVRQDPRAVRPADRPVPGGEAPLRRHAGRARAGRARPSGTPRARRARRPGDARTGDTRTPPAVRRGAVAAPDAAVAVRQDVHPGARRHRLHLGARRPPLLPPGAVAARRCSAGGEVGASRSPGSRWPESRRTLRARPARGRGRAARADPGGARRDRRAGRRGRRTGARSPRAAGSCRICPRPWGRGASPLEQLIIHRSCAAARRARRRPDHRRLGGARARSRTARRSSRSASCPRRCAASSSGASSSASPAPAPTSPRCTTRAERVDGGWRLTGQKIWTSLAQQADVGDLPRPHRPERAPGTTGSPTSSST